MAVCKVFAGEDSVSIVSGANYNGPTDSTHVSDFLWTLLKNTPYHASNLAWALGDLDWGSLENAYGDDDGSFHYSITVPVTDPANEQEAEEGTTYWIIVVPK